jgi:mannose-6-phosphate isomerase-like protein (cupin superfamily)
MLKRLKDCEKIIAGDSSILREFLHPAKADLKISYSLAHATVKPRKTTKPHKLKSSEVYYILSGNGLMHIDEQSFKVSADCAIYIPPRSTQYIENTGNTDLKFLCIVDPAWRKEDEEVLDS